MTIVDTDILIDAGRGVADAVDCLRRIEVASGLAISVVTQMELMIGCANKRELARLDKFLKRFQIVSLDAAACDEAVSSWG